MHTIIDGILNQGDQAFIIAPPKSRASLFATQLGLTIATGCYDMGFRCESRPVKMFPFSGNADDFDFRVHNMAWALRIDTYADRFQYGHWGDCHLSDACIANDYCHRESLAILDRHTDRPQLAKILSQQGKTVLSVHPSEKYALRNGDVIFRLKPSRRNPDEVTLSFTFRYQRPLAPWSLQWKRGHFVRIGHEPVAVTIPSTDVLQRFWPRIATLRSEQDSCS